MSAATKFSVLKKIWESNNRVTRTELMIELKTNPQNISRWMKSIGYSEEREGDGEWRYKPVKDVVVVDIVDLVPPSCTQRQRIKHYIRLGHSNASICLKESVLDSTVANYRTQVASESPVVESGVQQAMPLALEVPLEADAPFPPDNADFPPEAPDAPPAEDDNYTFENNQDGGKFSELGDETLPHISAIVQGMFFPNGVPKCQPCQRLVLYTDLVFRYNSSFPKYPGSRVDIDAQDKTVFPWPIAQAHVEAWGKWAKFPKTGYPEIDDLRLAQAFWEDSLKYFLNKRIGWIHGELSEGRKSGDRKP